MEFKLSNVLSNYIQYLEAKQLNTVLTKAEKQYLETKTLPDDLLPNAEFYLRKILNDIFGDETILNMFDYSQEERKTFLENINVTMDDQLFTEFVDWLVEENTNNFIDSTPGKLTDGQVDRMYLNYQKGKDIIDVQEDNGDWFTSGISESEDLHIDFYLPKLDIQTSIKNIDASQLRECIFKMEKISVETNQLTYFNPFSFENVSNIEFCNSLESSASGVDMILNYGDETVSLEFKDFTYSEFLNIFGDYIYVEDEEVNYDNMEEDEILNSYDNFKGWAEDIGSLIDFNNVTEQKYNDLYKAVFAINQGLTVTDFDSLIVSIQKF